VTYRLSIRKETEADIAEAYQYYEICSEGLGADFMLVKTPNIGSLAHNKRMQADQQTATRFVSR
jgi:hypothetical protein